MASVKVLLYTSKVLKNGEHPIMLRLIKDRKIKYVSLDYSCSKELWDEDEQRPVKKHPHKVELNIKITKMMNDANKIILDFDNNEQNYSVDDIAKALSRKVIGKRTVFQFTDELVQRHKEVGKVGTADAFQNGKRIVSRFTKEKDISFKELDYIFLTRLEDDLLKRKVTENSIAVYMRTLRSIYNKAIAEGHAKENDYPFKAYKLTKLNTKTKKRALTKEQVKSISDHKLELGSKLWIARSIFLFSYYCRGVNFIDVAQLKWSNIDNGRVHYTRAKTGHQFNIALLPPALEILEYYRAKQDKSGFIFPILGSYHDTEQKIKNRVKKIMKEVNSNLRTVAQAVKIDFNITTYVARHSYATVLKRQNVSTSQISEALGHSSEKITQVYLDSFENTVLDEADKFLL
ncbi:hypothetical protein TH61_08495 [Rufibacter sp. DG15C]|uniref:site-specific integrase n=1 Tax=Rufibacter sp. DG15C TaxID=1379909 RepID=UPI00078B3566|nr:site-specific integrase [Rufibacter sp. DG15C]AMM51207.1 hypothetical protein TH61_08495 [Rufibacter sp. DG15C]